MHCSVSLMTSLVYRAASSVNKWTPHTQTLLDATCNGSAYTVTVSSIRSALASDTDLSVTSPSNKKLIQYNSSTSKWNNTAVHTHMPISAMSVFLQWQMTVTGYNSAVAKLQYQALHSMIQRKQLQLF